MKEILVANIGTELGGIERSLISFLKYLVKCDCKVDLLLWKRPGPLFSQIPKGINILESPGPGAFKDIIRINNVTKKALRLCSYFRYKRFSKKGIGWRAIPPLQKEYDIAISYCQNGLSPYYVIENIYAKKKYMFYHHGSYEKTIHEHIIDAEIYSKYDKIICVSESNRSMLVSHFPEISRKFIVIHNLIDEERILRKAREPKECFHLNKNRIVTVGRLSKEKGQMFSLNVANQLKDKMEFEWVFVGDGPEMDKMAGYIEQHDLSGFCRLVGAQENPYPYINQSDYYIQTSYVEADPVTIKEAMILNKMIIASDIQAIADATNGYGCATICPLELNRFTDVVFEFLSNTNQRNKKNYVFDENIKIKTAFDELFNFF